MDKKRYFFLNKKGQSTVEYVLLLVVIAVLASAVFKNRKFKEVFGEDSELFATMSGMMEYSFRHGKPGLKAADQSNYENFHESYFNTKDSHTHFFIGQTPYPEN